jgi:hypothetical protein
MVELGIVLNNTYNCNFQNASHIFYIPCLFLEILCVHCKGNITNGTAVPSGCIPYFSEFLVEDTELQNSSLKWYSSANVRPAISRQDLWSRSHLPK